MLVTIESALAFSLTKYYKRLNLLIFCFQILCLLYSSPVFSNEKVELRIGTGTIDGAYHQFAEDVIETLSSSNNARISLINVVTSGTVENLKRLREKDLDIAIVQNDIGHYIYYGKHGHNRFQGFGAVLPLFPEYVQVITRIDNSINLLSDLNKKKIVMGTRNSGSYWNALDLLQEVGLRINVDYQALPTHPKDGLHLVSASEADAVVYTSAELPSENVFDFSNLQIIPVPSEIINSLSLQKPYYSPAELTIKSDQKTTEIPTLSVMAYLVAGTHVTKEHVNLLIKDILDNWNNLALKKDTYSLTDIKTSIRSTPFPWHQGAESALINEGHLSARYEEYFFFASMVLITFIVYWAQRKCDRYDRLGYLRNKGNNPYLSTVQFVARLGTYIYILIGFSILVIAIVFTIQYFEESYAREINLPSVVAEFDFSEALLWMFLFMSSGHTGDAFPISPTGRILAGALPSVGIATLIGFIYTVVEKQRAARTARKQGLLINTVKNHVLICGWNEKVPSLIYSLTSDEVPVKMRVVVVAEIDKEMPLEGYVFDHRYVSYCRGDSADHSVLDRAHAHNASAAIVVAGLRKRAGRNIRSLLSVMALKSYADNDCKDSLFIAAEMVYEENKNIFESCGADAIINSDRISNRMAAQCCISDHIVDFVMDILTYDNHSEIYSCSINEALHGGLQNCSNPNTRIRNIYKVFNRGPRLNEDKCFHELTLGDTVNILAKSGINVLGAARNNSTKSSGVLDYSFNGDARYILAAKPDDLLKRLGQGDSIIYVADERNDLQRALHLFEKDADYHNSRKGFLDVALPALNDKKILLVGPINRCISIAQMLVDLGLSITIITQDTPLKVPVNTQCVVGSPLDKSIWIKVGAEEYDRIVILHANNGKEETLVISDQGEIDAPTILAAKVARQAISSNRNNSITKTPTIIAEAINLHFKNLFKDAGVDVVIPCQSLVERIMTKLVYNRGKVCDFLIGLMALEDKVHFLSYKLKEHDSLCGTTSSELFLAAPNGMQVVGLLPGKQEKRIATHHPDFDYHFLTHTNMLKQGYQLEAGDLLMLIVDRSDTQP